MLQPCCTDPCGNQHALLKHADPVSTGDPAHVGDDRAAPRLQHPLRSRSSRTVFAACRMLAASAGVPVKRRRSRLPGPPAWAAAGAAGSGWPPAAAAAAAAVAAVKGGAVAPGPLAAEPGPFLRSRGRVRQPSL